MSFESLLFQSSQLFISFSKDIQERYTFWPYLSVLWTVFFLFFAIIVDQERSELIRLAMN